MHRVWKFCVFSIRSCRIGFFYFILISRETLWNLFLSKKFIPTIEMHIQRFISRARKILNIKIKFLAFASVAETIMLCENSCKFTMMTHVWRGYTIFIEETLFRQCRGSLHWRCILRGSICMKQWCGKMISNSKGILENIYSKTKLFTLPVLLLRVYNFLLLSFLFSFVHLSKNRYARRRVTNKWHLYCLLFNLWNHYPLLRFKLLNFPVLTFQNGDRKTKSPSSRLFLW